MFINTNTYAMNIDEFSAEKCSGWYVRKDGEDNTLNFVINQTLQKIKPNITRRDVVDTGLATNHLCGFSIVFSPSLKNGDIFTIISSLKEVLFQQKINMPVAEPSPMNERLMAKVEPFVEMDMDRVRQKLMCGEIYSQYKNFFKDALLAQPDIMFKAVLCDVLADIKTTQHLLSAAYLAETRYKDPDFLASLPKFSIHAPEKLVLDMRGDITGSNWYEADPDGRWAGQEKTSTIFLPQLEAGSYQIDIEFVNVISPGGLANVFLTINGRDVALEGNRTAVPCKLHGNFAVISSPDPFLILEFHYNGEVREPDGDTSDRRKLSFKLSNISIARING